MDAREIIAHYRQLYGHYKLCAPWRPDERSQRDLDDARAYDLWCRAHDVSPLDHMALRFEHLWRSKGALPVLKALRSEGRKASFVYGAQVAQEQRVAPRALPLLVQRRLDAVAYVASREHARERWRAQGRQHLCASADTIDGYDPRSRICPSCPQAAACAALVRRKYADLGDVIAARAAAR